MKLISYTWSRGIAFFFLFTFSILIGRHLSLLAVAGPPTFWPAAGVYFAYLLLTPTRAWPKIALAAYIGWCLGNWLTNVPVSPVIFFLLGKSLVFSLVIAVYRRYQNKFSGIYRQSLALVILGGFIAPALGAVFSLFITYMTKAEPFSFLTWRFHFVATSLGVLTVGPCLLAFYENFSSKENRDAKFGIVDLFYLLIPTTIAYLIFFTDGGSREMHAPFLIIPVLIWIAFQGKPGLAAAANFIVTLIEITATLKGTGPFVYFYSEKMSLMSALQMFVGILGILQTLILAAVLDRKNAALQLEKKTAELAVTNRNLEDSRKSALEASRAKGQFLANMSHEIRSPLGAMIGFTDLISGDTTCPPHLLSHIEVIKRNGQHLNELLNQILDLSKIESGRLETVLTSVDLPQLISDIQKLMQVQCLEKNISLIVNISPDLPKFIKTDALRLRQILINVLNNAIKFTDKGFISLRASIHDHPSRQKINLNFDFEDTGIGLTTEEQARLFQEFSQAHATTSHRYGGTGLGLVLCKHLAVLLDGRFELVQSQKGMGSTFRLSICTEIVVPPLVSEKTPPHVFTNQQLAGKHILAVDDSQDNLTLIEIFLKNSGATVECAENGLKAIERAKSQHFDLIIMDLEMPQLDGLGAMSLLKKSHYSSPVVALTGRGMPDEIQRCYEVGFHDHITKPVQRNDLILKISNILSRQHAFTEIPSTL